MLNKRPNTSNAALLSSLGTSAHDTGIRFSTLSPYEYFHSQGIDLQGFTLRFLESPRKNGVALCCTANISGITYTVGAPDYETLLSELLDDYHRHQLAVARSRERKFLRCTSRFINRHPDTTVLPAYLS